MEQTRRDKLHGTNFMGQGFCKILQFHVVFSEILRFPAHLCENLHLCNAVSPKESESQQNSAKLCEQLRICVRLKLVGSITECHN